MRAASAGEQPAAPKTSVSSCSSGAAPIVTVVTMRAQYGSPAHGAVAGLVSRRPGEAP